MKDKKTWIIISAVSGFTAVAIGAFGAHGLREKLSAEMLEVYKTGVFYQFIHTIVLLILSLTNFTKSNIASIFFLTGDNTFLILALHLFNIRISILCDDNSSWWSVFSDCLVLVDC